MIATIDMMHFASNAGGEITQQINASAADILAPGPVIAVPAAAMGLLATDNIDALDISLDPDGDLVADSCDNCPARPLLLSASWQSPISTSFAASRC